ncbi:MAG: porin [Aromatoleum sp.]|jgi:predicted porin|uniref:porin n=1 Tax=Aromatoleum sp. TaxID=2307007 RepID=UPI0028960514|nr:porin [Aromatoleum sp.]MDT3670654.1 porin [Aromatoleum sp.]
MQKKLIALAIAGLVSAPVFAQSNVTVYGVVDAYFGYGKYDDNKFTGVSSGGLAGSRIGFRGTEDLGNGLKGVFTLEYGIDIDQNEGIGSRGTAKNSATRARQQFVGLQGDFGFVGLGRQYSPGYWTSAKYDAIPTVPFSPQFLLANTLGSNIVAGSAARVSNSVNYKSPNWGGLTLNAIYGFNEENQDNNRRSGDLAAIGADYSNGPLGIGLVYSQVKQDAGTIGTEKFQPANIGSGVTVTGVDPVNGFVTGTPVGLTTADKTKKEWYLGAGYDLGMVKLVASYQQIKDATVAEDKDKVWQVGAVVPVSAAGKLHASYGRISADANNLDSSAATLLYSHGLSKRTTVYTGLSMIDNDDAAAITSQAKTTGQSLGEKDKNFFVGLNHTF